MTLRKGVLLVFGVFVLLGSVVAAQGNETDTAETETGADVSAIDYKKIMLEDQEFKQALERMFSVGMTRLKTVEEFRGDEPVTRQQAAKFFSQFAKEVMYSTMDVAKYCRFSDLDSADPSLKNYILEACLFSLFQGSSGKFSPHTPLTKDQALAVLMRAVEGGFLDERNDPRRKPYYDKAVNFGITKETDLSKFAAPITRYELALLLYRAGRIVGN